MKQRKPILPFEESGTEQPPAILLVQQQGQNEQMLGNYIEQIKTILIEIKELKKKQSQWERELIAVQGKDHSLSSKLYAVVEDMGRLELKCQNLHVKAKELSGTMKITSDQIKTLLQDSKRGN